MAKIKIKGIPSPSSLPPEIQAFAGPVKEAIDILLGRTGDGKDAAITQRNAAIALGGTTIINTGAASGGGYVPDLTPPPAPTGVSATPGFSLINLEWDDAPYSAGHGHAYTAVYRSSDGLRGNAVQVGMAPGTIYVDSVGSSAGPFYYWIRFVSRDGVVGPWNAVDGVSASTSASPDYLLGLLAGSIDEDSLKTEVIGGKDAFVFNTKTFAIKHAGSGYVPFIVQTTPTVINGHTIPAGVYLDAAFMRRFVAQAGQIGSLAVDDAAIANVSAAKLTIGDGTVGGRLKSAYFASGVAGWQIHPDGTAEFNNVLVHGTVYAESGYFKGTLMGGAVTSIGSGTGLWAGYDGGLYKFRLGVPGSSRMEWNGSAFTIYGSGGQVLMSSGSGIPWSQIESRPTSLAALDASASTKLNGIQDGATVGANASNLNIGLGANLLPNTEFVGGLDPAVLGWNPGACDALSLRKEDVWKLIGAQTLQAYQNTRAGNQWNVGCDVYISGGYGSAQHGIPVLAGRRYEFSAKLASHRCDSGLWVAFFDASNTYLGAVGSGWVQRNSGGPALTANEYGSGWTHAAVFATAPANAVYACPFWRRSDGDTPNTDSYAWLAQPLFAEATAAQTVPSTYSPGTSYAALTANWSSVSGPGKPQDNATYGATIGANLYGQITSENASTYIANAAIGQAQIDRLSANKLRVLEADIETASVSTLKIKGYAVIIPQYAESGAKQISYQPSGAYDFLVSTPYTLYDDTAKVLAIFTVLGWPAFGNPADNAAIEGRIVWEGVTPEGAYITNTRNLVIGDFYKGGINSCITTNIQLEVTQPGCTWSVRFYIRTMYAGQVFNIVRSSVQLQGAKR